MKIAAISDTHGWHGIIEPFTCDVLIVAGDFCNRGSLKEVAKFNDWLGNLGMKKEKILCIAGNHDVCLQQFHEKFVQSLFTNATYLFEREVTIDGVKIWGSPWQPTCFDWAFGLPRGNALKKKWDRMPEDTDVLITHCPPAGILDSIPDPISGIDPGDGHLGCEDLRNRILEVKPKYHVFGHIHEWPGVAKLGETICFNVSLSAKSPTVQTFEI